MVPEIYIFGKKNRIDLALLKEDSHQRILFQLISDNKVDEKLFIYGKNNLVYYSYVKRLPNNSYFAFGFLFHGTFCVNIKFLFEYLSETIKRIVKVDGEILRVNENGDIYIYENEFSQCKPALNKLTESLKLFFFNCSEELRFERIDDKYFQNSETLFDSLSINKISQEDTIDNFIHYNKLSFTRQLTTTKFENKNHLVNYGFMGFFILPTWAIILWYTNCNYIILLFILIFFLIVLFIAKTLKSYRFENLKYYLNLVINKSKEDPFSVLGVFLAIFSIYLSIFWNTLSQYDDIKQPIRNLYNKDFYIHWNKLVQSSDTINQNIVFLLDHSESMKTKQNSDIDTNLLEDILDRTGWRKEEKKIGNQYSDLITFKLQHILFQLNQNKIKGTFSIVKFSEIAWELDKYSNLEINELNLKQAFEYADSINFTGKKTNFIKLLQYLKDRYPEGINNEFKKPKNIFIFLSDYIHDNNYKVKDALIIKNLFNEIGQKSIQNNFYYTDGIYNKEITKTKTTFVLDLFKDRNEFYNSSINLLDSVLIINKILQPKPIKFHYDSHFFSDDIVTNIIFPSSKSHSNYKIGVKHGEGKDHRQIYKCSFGDKEEVRLTEEVDMNINVTNHSRIMKLQLSGHITDFHTNTEIIIKDKLTEFHFETICLKKLPNWLKLFFPIFALIFSIYIILLFYPS